MAIGNESWLINVEWLLVVKKCAKDEESVLIIGKGIRNKNES